MKTKEQLKALNQKTLAELDTDLKDKKLSLIHILHVFERAMDGASKNLKNTVQGQISLFGLGDAAVEPPPPPLPDIREFAKNELLQMEKEMTGVYISGHPLDQYRQTLNALPVNSRFLAGLSEEADGGMQWDQKTVAMGGIVAERKLKAVKSGNLMAFLQLEDLYGTTEDVYKRQRIRSAWERISRS